MLTGNGRKNRKATVQRRESQSSVDFVGTDAIADLAIDIWKITRRAASDGASERVMMACERAGERLERLGFEIVNFKGLPYDCNMRVKVVEHDGGTEPYIISECLTPAVYFKGELLRQAEVVTKGA